MLQSFVRKQFRPLVNRRNFTVLGLESSADDTCAAVVTSDRRILSNVVGKQNALHEPYGGIEPLVAIKAHHALMPGVVRQALAEAGVTMEDIDGVAYTRGPGMLGCLRTCSVAARTLATVHNKPLVGVHHMQAHALTPLLTSPSTSLPKFPFLTLLISGGHTLMLHSTSSTQHRIIAGKDVDLSIGRAFDKAAKLLEIPWGPKGPGAALEAFVATASAPSPDDPKFTVPAPGRLQFSYAGLLSQVDRAVTRGGDVGALSVSQRAIIARAFQQAAFAQLSDKILLFMKESDRQGHVPICDVVISGGVASNTYMRERFATIFKEIRPEVRLHYPPPALCTDNAAMIAWASMDRFLAGDTDPDDLEIRAQWSIEDLKEVANSAQ